MFLEANTISLTAFVLGIGLMAQAPWARSLSLAKDE